MFHILHYHAILLASPGDKQLPPQPPPQPPSPKLFGLAAFLKKHHANGIGPVYSCVT